MDIQTTTRNGCSVITLKGDFNFGTCGDFEDVLEQTLTRGESVVVLDLSGVDHIDSMGLGCLTRLWKHAGEKSAAMHIAGANKNVRGLINLVNLDKRMKMFDSVEEAVS